MEWKSEWTIALVPILAALVASVILTMAGQSAATAQWGAIIAFFLALPFCIARLLERAR